MSFLFCTLFTYQNIKLYAMLISYKTISIINSPSNTIEYVVIKEYIRHLSSCHLPNCLYCDNLSMLLTSLWRLNGTGDHESPVQKFIGLIMERVCTIWLIGEGILYYISPRKYYSDGECCTVYFVL